MKKRYVIIFCLLLVSLGIFPMITMYMGKQQAKNEFQEMVGSVYQKNPALADEMLKTAFHYRENVAEDSADSHNWWKIGLQAARNLGYTEEAYQLLFQKWNTNLFKIIVFCLPWAFVLGLFFYFWLERKRRKKYIQELSERIYQDLRCQINFGVSYQRGEWYVLEKEIKSLLESKKSQHSYMEKREEQIQMFMENIAHQIKTPLAGILLNLERVEKRLEKIEDKRLKMECRNILEDSISLGENIRQHIMRLLNLARLEAGEIHFRKDVLVLSDLLEEARNKYGEDKVIIERSSSEEILIRGDWDWLMEAICNLVENSLYHGESKLPIRIVLTEWEQEVKISLIDEGKGMEPEEIKKIFDRYHTSSSNGQFSTGIGMNLAKYVIRGHCGDISIESKKDYGTKIDFCLPRIFLKEKVTVM